MNSLKTFSAVYAKQSAVHDVLTFTASAADILDFAAIDRAGRETDGSLSGFQRPQIAGHIPSLGGTNPELPTHADIKRHIIDNPGTRGSQALAKVAHMDMAMLGLTFLMTVSAAILAGLLPTWRACQVTPAIQLKSQ